MRIGKCWKEWKVRFGIRKMGFLEREREWERRILLISMGVSIIS